jgi:nucleoid-associated protein YgaU
VAENPEIRVQAVAALIEAQAAGLARAGQLTAAEDALRKLILQTAGRVQSRLLLARILGQQGRYEEALAAIAEVEGVEAARLRSRLERLRSQGRRSAPRWQLAAGMVGLAIAVTASVLVRSPEPRATSPLAAAEPARQAAVARGTDPELVNLLTGWVHLIREVDSLPAIHRVRLQAEARDGAPLVVIEGTVVSESVARRLREAVAGLPLDADLSRLSVSRSYRVADGDNLNVIAKRVYGEAARWPAIWKANRGTLADPDRLVQGTVLVLP